MGSLRTTGYQFKRGYRLWVAILYLALPSQLFPQPSDNTPSDLDAAQSADVLVKAILSNDLEQVKALVETGSSIHTTSKDGWTPLMVAASAGTPAMVEFLVAQGSSINRKAKGDWNALAIAAYRENADIIPILLKADADPNSFVLVPFKFILAQLPPRSNTIMRSLIEEYEHSGEPAKSTFELSPLMLAVLRRNTNIAKTLIAAGAKPNLGNSFGTTPLFWAVIGNNDDMAKALCDSGADINLQTQLGKSPLVFAAGFGFANLTQTLIDKGADIDAADNLGNTALTYAVSLNRDAVLKVLIDEGADLNPRDSRGGTPILLAVERDFAEIVNLLLRAGADPNVQAQDGWSPLHEAAAQDNLRIAQQLLKAGAQVNDRDGLLEMTPLMWASSKGSTKMVRLLLGANADSSLKDRYGQTAERIARQKGHFDIERMLAQNSLQP